MENIKKIARMDKNKVINIELATQEWIDAQEDPSIFIEYTDENPAAPGGDYVDGYFYNVQPFPSWIRNKGLWVSPAPYPQDEKSYYWDEDTTSWIEIITS